jgi:hypothetical protein
MTDEKFEVVLSAKQRLAWEALHDKETNEVLYGGGAGGGKSFIGCLWLLVMCQQYPKTRWLMGRAVLKALKESTLKTFIDLVSSLNWQNQVHINQLDGNIRFQNGSEIILKDLFAYPSDPNYDSLGSTEYTGAFIDEASQVSEKAKNIVMSRIRYRLDEYGLIPKMLICSNPAKNWMYSQFYKPSLERKLPKDRKFIQSLVGDNPHISPHYIALLQKLDPLSKERLLLGNWEYDDDLGKLFKYENILNIFTNSFVKGGEHYLVCDAARKGSDKCVIYYWDGLRVEKCITYDVSLTTTIEATLLEWAERFSVPRSNIIIDEDGVGGGIVDHLPGCYGFVNNASPIGKENFANLKSQCYFKAAELVEKNLIFFAVDDMDIQAKLIEDLEQITQKNPDKDDNKLAIISKDVIKQKIGRSTDYSDAFAMRMVKELGVKEEYHVAKALTVRF